MHCSLTRVQTEKKPVVQATNQTKPIWASQSEHAEWSHPVRANLSVLANHASLLGPAYWSQPIRASLGNRNDSDWLSLTPNENDTKKKL